MEVKPFSGPPEDTGTYLAEAYSGLPLFFALLIVATLVVGLLGGCSTPTVTKVTTQEVRVPVATQPIRADQVPAVPAPLPPRSGNLSADADTLLAKVCDFAAYAIKADPLLRLSAGEPPAPLPRFPECERGGSSPAPTPAPPPGR